MPFMDRSIIGGLIGLAGIAILAAAAYWYNPTQPVVPVASSEKGGLPDGTINKRRTMSQLTLSSPAFERDGGIPSRFTCDGENISPPLSWTGVSGGTQSLVLIADDPDVPKQVKPDGVFDHWTLFNISPSVTEIPAGGTAGVAGANSTGKSQYVGPCPPKEFKPSQHRYFFRLYALDAMLPLRDGALKTDVLEAMSGHIIGQTELMGIYERP